MPSWPLVLPEFWPVTRQEGWLTVCTRVGVSMCAERTGGLWGACLWGYLGLTCPCRARSGCSWVLPLCRAAGGPGKGLEEGGAWGLTGVPRLRDQDMGVGDLAFGCGV